MSVISGKKILEEIGNGSIVINPFDMNHLNPISVDLTLGSKVAVYESVTEIRHGEIEIKSGSYIDSKKEEPVHTFDIPDSGLVLKPGIGYLMHTHEMVGTKKYVPIIDGKSSVGRLFIQIHSTAGLGDPGFFGQFTLEVMVSQKVKVYKGMRIGQVRFYEISGEYDSYETTGNYNGINAIGPIPSKLWKSFNG